MLHAVSITVASTAFWHVNLFAAHDQIAECSCCTCRHADDMICSRAESSQCVIAGAHADRACILREHRWQQLCMSVQIVMSSHGHLPTEEVMQHAPPNDVEAGSPADPLIPESKRDAKHR